MILYSFRCLYRQIPRATGKNYWCMFRIFELTVELQLAFLKEERATTQQKDAISEIFVAALLFMKA